jgi:hypothetical protein
MKKKQRFLTKVLPHFTGLLLTMAFVFFVTGCNSETDKEKKSINDSDTSASTDSSTGAAVLPAVPLSGGLHAISLPKDEYKKLIRTEHGKKAEKLVFQFYFDASKTNYPTLVAYPGLKGNKYKSLADESIMQYILIPTGGPLIALGGIKILGDQEVSIDVMIELIRKVAGGNIDAIDHFVFTPQVDGTNHIYYVITISNFPTPAADAPQTNPSPPKDAD